jgi:hypothetical protein
MQRASRFRKSWKMQSRSTEPILAAFLRPPQTRSRRPIGAKRGVAMNAKGIAG